MNSAHFVLHLVWKAQCCCCCEQTITKTLAAAAWRPSISCLHSPLCHRDAASLAPLVLSMFVTVFVASFWGQDESNYFLHTHFLFQVNIC